MGFPWIWQLALPVSLVRLCICLSLSCCTDVVLHKAVACLRLFIPVCRYQEFDEPMRSSLSTILPESCCVFGDIVEVFGDAATASRNILSRGTLEEKLAVARSSDSTLSLIDPFQSVSDLTVPELKAIRKRIKNPPPKIRSSSFLHTSKMIFTLLLFISGAPPDIYANHLLLARLTFMIFMVNSLLNTSGHQYLLNIFHEKSAALLPIILLYPPSPSPTTDCDSPFTMAELNIVLRSLSRGRAPGPDSITTEMLKGSPYILKLFLLDHSNHCVATSSTSDSWALSEVVMLVKKIQNDTRDLSNYHPISLTNSMCKIFASLMQKRLSHHFDDRIRSTQFGFRAKCSTTQPIHIMRRILEVFERQQNSLHLLFLDWSKAFDSVSFQAIESALLHFGVPTTLVKSILSLYSSPKFTVRDAGF